MSRRAHQNAYAKAGREAAAVKGWLGAHKWLLARRAAQFGFLALFLAGPVAGWWLVKGNMASSLTLGWLELTDPLVLLQSALAGHTIAGAALGGAAIVFVVYALIGGRVYCSWVCPVNIVTDGAHWGRQKLGLRGGVRPSRRTRHWLLAAALVVAAATGTIAWELVNPVSMVYRGLIFGLGAAWVIIAAVLILDLIVGNRLWCGHLCPVGAFYGLIGSFSVIRVRADRRDACTDCLECYAVCPEPHVITPALKGGQGGKLKAGPVILSGDCTNCGRCIDVCAVDVFGYGARFHNPADGAPKRTNELESNAAKAA